MNGNENVVMEIDLLKLAKAVWRRIWLVMISIFICGAIGFAYAETMVSPLYKANTMIYVNNTALNINGKVTLSSHNSTVSQSLVSTYQVILDTRATMNRILESTNLNYSCNQLRSMISTAAVEDTEVLRITVTSSDPTEAELIANSIADILPERISDVVEGSSVKVVDTAVIPSSRSYPNATKFATVGFLVGAIFSIGLISVRELMDNQVRTEKDLTDRYPQAPVLALIPNLFEESHGGYSGYNGYSKNGYGYGHSNSQKKGKRQEGSRKEATSAAASSTVGSKSRQPFTCLCRDMSFSAKEAYKLLRTNIMFSMPDDDGCRVLGITSALRGDGKSTTALNLSYTVAESGKKVLLLEADMRLPNLGKRLGLSTTPGLSNILVGLARDADAIQPSGLLDTLDVLVAGDVPPNPSELLGSERMKVFLESVRSRYDYVIADLPPVNAVADSLVISHLVQRMVVVVRQNYDDFTSLTDAMKRLEYLKCKVLGLVMTCVSFSDDGYSSPKRYGRFGGYKRYGYRYGGGYHRYESNHYGYEKYEDHINEEVFRNAVLTDSTISSADK